MSTAKDTYALLKYFIQRYQNPIVEYRQFSEFVRKYAEKYHKDRPTLQPFLEQGEGPLREQLRELERDHLLVLRPDADEPDEIVFSPYYREAIKAAYRKAEAKPEVPFPSDDSLRQRIPDELVRPVEVRTSFVNALRESETAPGNIYRLSFPDGILPMIATGDLLEKKLLELSIQKIRLYLSTQRNADYVRQKLLSIFSSRHLMMKDMVDSILMKPGYVAAQLLKPNEFAFAFWAHLSNFINLEYQTKTSRLAEEHGFCQAAHLIGLYVMFYKGRTQKEHQSASALKSLEFRLKKSPYAFPLTDIYHIKDEKGIPLLKKCSQDEVNGWVEERVKPVEGELLPMLIRMKPAQGTEFYVHREGVVPLLMRMIIEAEQKLKDHYVDTWVAELRQYRKSDIMLKDEAFLADLTERVRRQFPVLNALLNYNLLALVRRDGKYERVLSTDFQRIFAENAGSLKPLTEILGLRRAELYNHAGLHLSFWEILPRWKSVLEFFRRIFRFGGTRAKSAAAEDALGASVHSAVSPGAARSRGIERGQEEERHDPVLAGKVIETDGEAGKVTARQQNQQYTRALRKLREDIIGPDASVEEELASLIEKWNPLYDPRSKNDLVEDVNSMIRDFIRRMKASFRVKPPDRDRVRNMADLLASNAAFDRIRKKDSFRTYVMLYMLKLLGER